VLAQRLVRRICPECKSRYQPDKNLLDSLSNSVKIGSDAKLYHGTGCSECNDTGMRGRVGIFELLRITDKLRKLIASRPTTEKIIKAAGAGLVSMRHDGVEKILVGITTAEEVLRVTQGIDDE
jgi:type II secretory ATPase GspE/PulE/Tfp pilus assembly ATPase PilB-like protein